MSIPDVYNAMLLTTSTLKLMFRFVVTVMTILLGISIDLCSINNGCLTSMS